LVTRIKGGNYFPRTGYQFELNYWSNLVLIIILEFKSRRRMEDLDNSSLTHYFMSLAIADVKSKNILYSLPIE